MIKKERFTRSYSTQLREALPPTRLIIFFHKFAGKSEYSQTRFRTHAVTLVQQFLVSSQPKQRWSLLLPIKILQWSIQPCEQQSPCSHIEIGTSSLSQHFRE